MSACYLKGSTQSRVSYRVKIEYHFIGLVDYTCFSTPCVDDIDVSMSEIENLLRKLSEYLFVFIQLSAICADDKAFGCKR